ncbi:MAG TPA: hypothetical protein V6C97_03040 [Oculatellaceae cyanobacterium]
MTKRHLHRRRSRAKGFSLVTVLLVSALAGLWLAATTLAVMPVYQRVGQSRYREVARLAAEYGIEQEIANLNALLGATKNPFDGLSIGQTRVDNFTVPQNYGLTANAAVTVTNQAPPSTSQIYDPLADPTNPRSQLATILYKTKNVNDWRSLVSVGTYGSSTYTITVMVKPNYNYANTSSITPQFLSGEFGANEVSLLQNVNVTVPTNSNFADVGGGQAIYLGLDGENKGFTGKNVVVQGNVEVDGLSSNGAASGILDSSVSLIDGNLYTNGSVSKNISGFAQNDNVFGTQGIQAETSLSATMAPVPQAPSDATNLGFISATSSQNPTINLPAGNYIISGMNLPAGTSLSTSGAVNLFVQGDVGIGSSAINVASGATINNASGIPSNLNIYYNGANNVSIQNSNGTTTAANIYAPNATVSLGPTSSNANYNGSVVANALRIQNETVNFSTSTIASSGSLNGGAFAAGGAGNFRLISMTPVSYLEHW